MQIGLVIIGSELLTGKRKDGHLGHAIRTKIDLPLIIDLRPNTVKAENPKFLEDLTLKCLDPDV